MNSFYLAHLNQSHDLQDTFPGDPLWKTCMRTIVFFDGTRLSEVQSKADQQSLEIAILKEADAYRYLLEVICGLKSEIVGETQVLGQFKIFLAAAEKDHKSFYLNHYALFQSLLLDCKELREKHIQNWGGSSYGSLTRKKVELTPHISVLGNGQLAQSLLPWMKNKSVVVHGRNPRHALEQPLKCDVIQNSVVAEPKLRSLVIAAPVPNCFLEELLQTVPFHQVIDWRTEASLDARSLPAAVNYHSFKHLAEFMENEKLKKQKHIDLLSEVIQQKIDSWVNRRQLRPNGWDDLF